MLGTKNRNIKILAVAWLVLGGLAFAFALVATGQVIIDPSAAEDGLLGGVVFILLLLVLGTIQTVNGLSLLRRNPVARPIMAISSLVLLIPAAGLAATGFGVPALVVVLASLWLTLSRGGKETLESYMARPSDDEVALGHA